MHEVYGIDLDSDILDRRTWRWFSARIAGLLDHPHTRLYRLLNPRRR